MLIFEALPLFPQQGGAILRESGIALVRRTPLQASRPRGSTYLASDDLA